MIVHQEARHGQIIYGASPMAQPSTVRLAGRCSETRDDKGRQVMPFDLLVGDQRAVASENRTRRIVDVPAPEPESPADEIMLVFGGRCRPECPLTEMERQVLSRIADRMSLERIGAELHFSASAIRARAMSAAAKIGAGSPLAAAVAAQGRDWI